MSSGQFAVVRDFDRRISGLSDAPLFCAMMFLCANGLMDRVVLSVQSKGIWVSVAETFEISAILWFAILFALSRAAAAGPSPAAGQRRVDWLLCAGAIGASLIPIGQASWIVLTGLCLYVLRFRKDDPALRDAAWILLSVTVPLLWSKLLFNAFSEFILSIDASLVSLIMQTPREGNIVADATGQGYLRIAAPCSSLANTSLVLPLWTTLTRLFEVRPTWRMWIWPASAMLAAVGINVGRISAIGFFPGHYDLIHGETGQFVVNLLITAAIVWICYVGASRAKTV